MVWYVLSTIDKLITVINNQNSSNFFANNNSLVIPRPNRKGDGTYGIFTYPILKNGRIDIQSKVFDGATCIPTLHRLLKNCANITRSGI
jgi:hypothetical protein